MRSNPFATSFGKKPEARREDPESGTQAGQARFGRLQEVLSSISNRSEDLATAEPQATAHHADPVASDADPRTASSVDDRPVDANTLATLRSWGLPDAPPDPVTPDEPSHNTGRSDPIDPDPDAVLELSDGDWGVDSAEPAADSSDPQGLAAGATIDRLREELGADDDSEPAGCAAQAPDGAADRPCEPAAPRQSRPADQEIATESSQHDAAPAGPSFGRRIAPTGVARPVPAAAADWDQEEAQDELEDVAVTIGRVVSIRGAVIWGALFDDADGTTARAARMGALVSMRGPDSRVFGIVNGLQREQQGGNQAERTVFEIQVLGEIANTVPESAAGFQRGVSSYPPLDAPVTTVTLRDLAKVYARPRMSNVHVGRLRHNRKVPAFVLTDSLLGKHFAVLGTTGAGKSCAVTVILRSILDEHPHGHVILLDPHNEYASAFADKAELLNPSNLQLPYWLLNFEEIAHVLIGGQGNENSYAQTVILKDAILHAKKLFAGASAEEGHLTVDTPVPYRLSDLIAALKDGMGMLNKSERSTSPYLSLIARTESLRLDKRYAFMFSSIAVRDTMRQVLAQLVRIPVEGKPITIIDISGVPSEIVDVVVSVLFRLMFELAIWSERGAAPPMLLVCEEAHRYVPQEDGAGFAPTKRVISRIAKEGRKYGITLCLVSQRPSELSITSLSQCNTVFALRLSNEHDQAFVARALSENARWLVDSLPSLNTQEAVVVGDGVTVPVHIRFKDLKREHRPSSFDRSFSAAWRNEADPNFLDRTIDRWRKQAR
jgi:DNA helicase HerA-like ATPase